MMRRMLHRGTAQASRDFKSELQTTREQQAILFLRSPTRPEAARPLLLPPRATSTLIILEVPTWSVIKMGLQTRWSITTHSGRKELARHLEQVRNKENLRDMNTIPSRI